MKGGTRRILAIVAAVVTLAAVLCLCERRGITSLSDYLWNMHQPAVDNQPGSPGVDSPAGEDSPASTPSEPGGAKDGAADIPVSAGETGKDTPPAHDLGTLPATETREVETPGADGVVRRSTIELPPHALDWTRPERHPQPGEIISLELPVNHKFLFQVLSLEELPQGAGLVVYASLCNARGKVVMMFCEDHFSLQLQDEEAHRSYMVYYNVRENHYTVEEADSTLQRVTPAPPARH